MHDWIKAIILGIIEGLTEFLPISSTGHLLVGGKLLGFNDAAFTVMIQLGAILAILALYFSRLWNVVLRLPTDPEARRFAATIIIAFLPAAALGLLLHKVIAGVFFESTTIIAGGFIVGGIIMLLAEHFRPAPTVDNAEKLSLKQALAVGLFQCMALVPGMSRSGSTMIGAMLAKVDRGAAAEFSFFLAIPTILGAFVLDFLTYRDQLVGDRAILIAIGFAVSFLSALLVIKPFLNFVSKSGFAVFAWYRIAFGIGMLALFGMA